MTDEIRILARPPFDFAATARFLRFTENEVVDVWHEDRYRRAFHRTRNTKSETTKDDVQVLEVAFDGTTRSKPTLIVRLLEPESDAIHRNTDRNIASRRMASSEATLAEAAQLAAHIFNPQHDLRRFAAQVKDDALMSRVERAHRGLRMPRWASLFEALATSILSQQISTIVALTLKRRFVERYGARVTCAGREFFAFPRAEDLKDATDEDLRAMGISFAKAASILGLARSIIDGDMNESELSAMDNESAIAGLSTLRGVGRWTAEWALMLYFGRTDIFPAGDLALRAIVAKYYGAEAAKNERTLREFALERWGAWQSYVAIYMFAAMRTGRINLRERDDNNSRSAQLDHELKTPQVSSTKAQRMKQTTNMIESDTTPTRARLSKRKKADDTSSMTDHAKATQLSPRQVLIGNGKKR